MIPPEQALRYLSLHAVGEDQVKLESGTASYSLLRLKSGKLEKQEINRLYVHPDGNRVRLSPNEYFYDDNQAYWIKTVGRSFTLSLSEYKSSWILFSKDYEIPNLESISEKFNHGIQGSI